ncbi:hypothetical protein KA082_03160 [Candidatus Woesebacteria bacterium]|nr:hypothetical protein [Candidatus Woesebacteria bacterium]
MKEEIPSKSERILVIAGIVLLLVGWSTYQYTKHPTQMRTTASQLWAHTTYCLGIQPKIAATPEYTPTPSAMPTPTPSIYQQNTTYGTTSVAINYPSENAPATVVLKDETLSPDQQRAFDAVEFLAISSNTAEVLPVIGKDTITFFTIQYLGKPSDFQTKEIKLTTAPVSNSYTNAHTQTLAIIGEEAPFNNVYTGMKFIGYVPNRKAALLRSAGGDGCGGSGALWLMPESGNKEIIQTFGFGCANNLVRDGGTWKGKLLFANGEARQQGEYPEEIEFTKIVGLFTIDPVTLQKETIPFDANGKAYSFYSNDTFEPFNKDAILLRDDLGPVEYDPTTQTFVSHPLDKE